MNAQELARLAQCQYLIAVDHAGVVDKLYFDRRAIQFVVIFLHPRPSTHQLLITGYNLTCGDQHFPLVVILAYAADTLMHQLRGELY